MIKNTSKDRVYSYCMSTVLVLLLAGNVHAWVAHDGYYHSGYYHGNYYHGGSYYYGGYAAHGVVIGVPAGAYYGYGCGTIQKCYPSGACVNERVCN